MDKELVSVIIPVYNVENYIDKCMNSIIAQTYRTLEIILINDGSTDKSGEKCLQWCERDSRVIYISKSNEGLGSARNLGVSIASGKYIVFVDSDDWLSEIYIERLYASIVSVDADMAFCDYYKVDSISGVSKPFNTKIYTPTEMNLQEVPQLLYGADVAMWIKMYKRSLLVDNNIQIPNIPYEDSATYAYVAAYCNKIVRVKEKLLYYRINREGSILHNFYNRKRAIDALVFLCTQMKQRGLWKKYNEWLERFCVRFISYSIRELKLIENSEAYIEKLKEFLHKWFPNWEKPYGKKYLVIGSNNLYCMINQIPYDIDCVTRIEEVVDMRYLEIFDYIFFDFQPNKIGESLDTRKKLFDYICANGLENKVWVIENKLTEFWGEYEIEKSFSNIEVIRNINAQIDSIYKEIQGRKVNKLNLEDSSLHFCDKFSRHGCSPCHLNDMYFTKVADILIDKLGGRKLNGNK